MNELDRARYISLTTFKMDGSPVSSAVWITGNAGVYVFTTGDKTWKTKRLLRNSSVQVHVCDMRGRVKPQAIRYVGTGAVMTAADAVATAERALAVKYGWQFRATKLVDRIKGLFGGMQRQEPVAVQLSLSKGGHDAMAVCPTAFRVPSVTITPTHEEEGHSLKGNF